ncbi:MAG: T9SS type A sorting domain-containing protein, partial [Bacteroidota bacterium]|nr:T9SS type A sorting domain-containing protein [Bacteroidota bacterium]
GTSYMTDTIDVNARWNMIGTLFYPVLKADIEPVPPLIIQSNIFGYITGVGYYSEDTLEPGYGYWVKVSETGKLIVKTSSLLLQTAPKASVTNKKEKSAHHFATLANSMGLHELRITDADGKSSSLFFSAKHIKTELWKFDIPPPPPADNFDVRFSSHRLAEVANPERQDQTQKFPILINSAKDPITISWNVEIDENAYALEVAKDGEKIQKYIIKGSEKLTLNTSKLLDLKLVMGPSSEMELPKQYSLHQNYPNPFNPSTKIRYDLPKDARVTLKVYNLLGQEVKTLVDEIQNAGFRSVKWDASDSPSGVYIYRIYAEGSGKSFFDVKKMIIVK